MLCGADRQSVGCTCQELRGELWDGYLNSRWFCRQMVTEAIGIGGITWETGERRGSGTGPWRMLFFSGRVEEGVWCYGSTGKKAFRGESGP